MEKQRITVAAGDGIGPELLKAVLHIFEGAESGTAYFRGSQCPAGL